MYSRYEILLENYCKTLNIEALTMVDMSKRSIVPATLSYIKKISDTANAKTKLSSSISCELEKTLVTKLSTLLECLYKKTTVLENELIEAKGYINIKQQADYYKDNILISMQELRAVADEIEALVGNEYWPFPTYGQLLFSI